MKLVNSKASISNQFRKKKKNHLFFFLNLQLFSFGELVPTVASHSYFWLTEKKKPICCSVVVEHPPNSLTMLSFPSAQKSLAILFRLVWADSQDCLKKNHEKDSSEILWHQKSQFSLFDLNIRLLSWPKYVCFFFCSSITIREFIRFRYLMGQKKSHSLKNFIIHN